MGFARTFAAKAVPGVVGFFGDRTMRLASLAGLILCGLVALFAAYLLSGDDTARLDGHRQAQAKSQMQAAPEVSHQAKPGGETVIAKLDPVDPDPAKRDDEPKRDPAKPAQTALEQPKLDETKLDRTKPVQAEAPPPAKTTPMPRHLAMMLAPVIVEPPADEEPNLDGLNEIPPELIWNRPEKKEKEATPKAFAAFSNARDELAWGAVEPVPFAPLASDTPSTQADGAKPVVAALPPLNLPDSSALGTWLKSKVTEIKGADRSRPLYHFELWLEPPAALKQRLVGVAYEFSTPAIRPRSQASSDKTSGFRISAAGLACADEITLTLRFDDGSVEKAVVDGCKLLT